MQEITRARLKASLIIFFSAIIYFSFIFQVSVFLGKDAVGILIGLIVGVVSTYILLSVICAIEMAKLIKRFEPEKYKLLKYGLFLKPNTELNSRFEEDKILGLSVPIGIVVAIFINIIFVYLF